MHLARTARAALAGAAILTLAGCGGQDLSESVTEEAIERAAEAGGEQGDVEVDVDQEGESLTVTTEEGEVSMSMSEEDYPEDWPAEIPTVDLDIEASTSTGSGDFLVLSVSGTTTAAPQEVLDVYRDGMDGWAVASETSQTADGTTLDGVMFVQGPDEDDPDRVMNVSASTEDGGATSVSLNYQQYRAS